MDDWDKADRASKLASVLWPHLASPEIRTLMDDRLRNEGKRLKPIEAPPANRGACSPLGGKAKTDL